MRFGVHRRLVQELVANALKLVGFSFPLFIREGFSTT
jgi:hypothetical protein